MTVYGLSKQAGEVVAQCFARRSPMEICCLRPTLVMQSDIAYDPVLITAASDGGDPPPAASAPTWQTQSTVIPGSRAFVDPADAALEAEGRSSDVYNVAAADTYSQRPTRAIQDWFESIEPELL